MDGMFSVKQTVEGEGKMEKAWLTKIFRPDSLENFVNFINSHYPFFRPPTLARSSTFPSKKAFHDKANLTQSLSGKIHSKLFCRGFEMCASFLKREEK
jgi:hypothetical protein